MMVISDAMNVPGFGSGNIMAVRIEHPNLVKINGS